MVLDPRYYDARIPPAKRMAIIAVEVVRRSAENAKRQGANAADLPPDYADFESAFEPMLERELFAARLEQSVKDKAGIENEAAALRDKLMKISKKISERA